MARLLTLFILLAVSTHPAAAAQVFKCIEDGQTSYQSTPCNGPPAKVWEVTPEPPSAPPLAATRAGQREAARSVRPIRQPHAATRGQARKVDSPDVCKQTRQARQTAYRKAGLQRGFALSSYWDNRVRDACAW